MKQLYEDKLRELKMLNGLKPGKEKLKHRIEILKINKSIKRKKDELKLDKYLSR